MCINKFFQWNSLLFYYLIYRKDKNPGDIHGFDFYFYKN